MRSLALPRVPRRPVLVLHTVAATVVATWTALLAVVLSGPVRAEWLGYNLALVAMMVVTIRATRRATPAATTLSAALAAMVLADSWFDITTAPGDYLPWSVLSAATGEWPFALVCISVAARGFRPERPVPQAPEPPTPSL